MSGKNGRWVVGIIRLVRDQVDPRFDATEQSAGALGVLNFAVAEGKDLTRLTALRPADRLRLGPLHEWRVRPAGAACTMPVFGEARKGS